MADTNAHLKQFFHNRELIAQLPGTHSDWIATVAFYCAVQLIDAVLADTGAHPNDHRDRDSWVARVTRLEFIARKYDPLKQLARKVRYFADPTQWVPYDQIETNLLKRYLYPIEESAFKLLKRMGEIPKSISIAKPPSQAASTPPAP